MDMLHRFVTEIYYLDNIYLIFDISSIDIFYGLF